MTKLDMASANEDNHKPAAAMSSRMLSANVIIGISAFCLAFIACSGVAYLYLENGSRCQHWHTEHVELKTRFKEMRVQVNAVKKLLENFEIKRLLGKFFHSNKFL